MHLFASDWLVLLFFFSNKEEKVCLFLTLTWSKRGSEFPPLLLLRGPTVLIPGGCLTGCRIAGRIFLFYSCEGCSYNCSLSTQEPLPCGRGQASHALAGRGEVAGVTAKDLLQLFGTKVLKLSTTKALSGSHYHIRHYVHYCTSNNKN